MGKKGNAIMVIFTLLLDVAMGIGWYLAMFPPESILAVETVGITLMMVLGSVGALALSYAVYSICISEED